MLQSDRNKGLKKKVVEVRRESLKQKNKKHINENIEKNSVSSLCILGHEFTAFAFLRPSDGSSSRHEASVDHERTSFDEASQFESSHEPNATANEHRGNGSLNFDNWIIG